jgi:hypothetical protein
MGWKANDTYYLSLSHAFNMPKVYQFSLNVQNLKAYITNDIRVSNSLAGNTCAYLYTRAFTSLPLSVYMLIAVYHLCEYCNIDIAYMIME